MNLCFTFSTHRCNEKILEMNSQHTFKLKIFKLFIEIHCCKIHRTAVPPTLRNTIQLICCSIILTASSPGSLLIRHSLAICLRDLPPLLSGRVRLGVSCQTWNLMEAIFNPLRVFARFPKRTGPPYQCCVQADCSSEQFPGYLQIAQCLPNFERSTFLLCCQLPTDIQNISIV